MYLSSRQEIQIIPSSSRHTTLPVETLYENCPGHKRPSVERGIYVKFLVNQKSDLNPIEIQNWNCFDKYLWLECGHLFASPSGNSWATVHAFDVCRANAPNLANLDNPCQPSPEYFDFSFDFTIIHPDYCPTYANIRPGLCMRLKFIAQCFQLWTASVNHPGKSTSTVD